MIQLRFKRYRESGGLTLRGARRLSRNRFAQPWPVLALLLLRPAVGWPASEPSPSTQASAPTPSQPSAGVSESITKGFDLLARNDAAGAELAFRDALKSQPELERAHRGLGLALRAEGKLEAALDELQVATRLDPADAEGLYALGLVAWSLSAQPALSRSSVPAFSPSDYRGVASEAFRRALALRPQDVSMRLTLAELYLDAGRDPEALAQAEEAARLAPQNAAAHVMLGHAYFAAGQEDKAASEYQTALKLDPGAGDAYTALGRLQLFQHKYLQAEGAFRRAIEVSPGLAPAYAGLAQILIQHGRAAEARSLLEKAVVLDSQDWQSQFALAVLLSQAGEGEAATQRLEKVLRLRPGFLPAQEELALGLLRRGDLKGAGDEAEKMIVQDPQAAEGHRVLALVLWKQRNFDGSLTECAMALAGDPNSASMLALQAIALWQLDRKKEAQAAFRQAAKVEAKIGSAEVFCRLLLCEARDIGIVSDFLRKSRWVTAPPAQP
jgi:Tfp pilus assembly protein PilF